MLNLMTWSDSGFLALVSFRDPSLRGTLDVYSGIAEYVRNLELSDLEVERLIIAAIGRHDFPLTAVEKGRYAFERHLTGLSDDDIQQRRDAVLGANSERLSGLSPLFGFNDPQAQNGICVIGSRMDQDEEFKRLAQSLFRN